VTAKADSSIFFASKSAEQSRRLETLSALNRRRADSLRQLDDLQLHRLWSLLCGDVSCAACSAVMTYVP